MPHEKQKKSSSGYVKTCHDTSCDSTTKLDVNIKPKSDRSVPPSKKIEVKLYYYDGTDSHPLNWGSKFNYKGSEAYHLERGRFNATDLEGKYHEGSYVLTAGLFNNYRLHYDKKNDNFILVHKHHPEVHQFYFDEHNHLYYSKGSKRHYPHMEPDTTGEVNSKHTHGNVYPTTEVEETLPQHQLYACRIEDKYPIRIKGSYLIADSEGNNVDELSDSFYAHKLSNSKSFVLTHHDGTLYVDKNGFLRIDRNKSKSNKNYKSHALYLDRWNRLMLKLQDDSNKGFKTLQHGDEHYIAITDKVGHVYSSIK